MPIIRKVIWIPVVIIVFLCAVSLTMTCMIPVFRAIDKIGDKIEGLKKIDRCQSVLENLGDVLENNIKSDTGPVGPMGTHFSLESFECPYPAKNEKQASYVYRGSDLPSDISEDMIIAYDRKANHELLGVRNVLFTQYRTTYYIDGESVSKDTHEQMCIAMLTSGDDNMRLQLFHYMNEDLVAHRRSNDTLEFDFGQLPKSQAQPILDVIIRDFRNGTLPAENMWLQSHEESDVLVSRANASKGRAQTMGESEFVEAIRRDNALRKKMGLSVKPLED